MKLLLDTHLILWSVATSFRLSPAAAALIRNPDNELIFSVASFWEVAIKRARDRDDFTADPTALRRNLLSHHFIELPILSSHVCAVADLPTHHKDPFDRLLISQASVEAITLLTADPTLARYPGPIRLV